MYSFAFFRVHRCSTICRRLPASRYGLCSETPLGPRPLDEAASQIMDPAWSLGLSPDNGATENAGLDNDGQSVVRFFFEQDAVEDGRLRPGRHLAISTKQRCLTSDECRHLSNRTKHSVVSDSVYSLHYMKI